MMVSAVKSGVKAAGRKIAGSLKYLAKTHRKSKKTLPTNKKPSPATGNGGKNKGGGEKKNKKESSGNPNTGRQKNTINRPDSNAEGAPHSRFKIDENGDISNYATFESNPQNPTGLDLKKRVDLQGKDHEGISTPHVHEKVNGKKTVRPARLDEIPIGKK